MSRKSASPDADTRSYCPLPLPDNSDTISPDEPAYFVLTMHPVALWKGLTHWGWA